MTLPMHPPFSCSVHPKQGGGTVLMALLVGMLLVTAAQATESTSTGATVEESQTPAVLPGDQTIFRIKVEDDGSRIEEMRYGGITESISVNPKGSLAPYEVQPMDSAHSHPVERDRNPEPLGPRLWNLFDF